MPEKLGLYIHIPFCRSKCDYCDFYSLAGREERMDDYQKALMTHMKETAPLTRGWQVDTVYFGGGTPSFYGSRRLKELLRLIGKRFDLAKDAEITVECNPDSINRRDLIALRRAGANRISLGVQSAHDCELQNLRRAHTFRQAQEAVAAARTAKFKNISLDLIYGLPGQDMEGWQDTVEQALSLRPEHLSCYGLKVEPGTPLDDRVIRGERLPDDDVQADLYLWMVDRLAREGYRQYEIRNFACPGHEGRHNLLYWNCKDYWGIGPAAHSCLGSVRRFWPNDTAAFIAGTVQEQYEGPCNAEDYLIMQLRLCSGLNLTEYAARYGVRFDAGQMAFLRHCAASGYAVLDGDTLRLTPSGMIVQNAILEELI